MQSFTVRITLLFASLVTFTTALVLLAGGWLQSQQAVAGLDFLNAAEFEEIAHRLDGQPQALTAERVAELIAEHTEIDATLYFFQVIDARGALLFRSPNLGQVVLPAPMTSEKNRSEHIPALGRVRIGTYTVGELRVLVASSLEPADRLLRSYARISVLLLLGVGVVSVGLGWTFARLTLRPVRAIRETAARIGPDTLSERIPIPAGRDELSALAQLLNRMFDRIEGSFSQVRRFTADASHELKTPLALVRLSAEKLRTRLAHDPESTEIIGEILEDIDRLHQIIESLLFLAKTESGTFHPALGVIETSQFLQSFADDARVMTDHHGAQFSLQESGTGRVRGEPTLLRQMLMNLVTNACRVQAADGSVELTSEVEHGRWRVTISDHGHGVPPDQIERIFERFVRLTPQTKNGPGDGHGLGLAICRSIVALHGGTIRAENRRDRSGLRMIVELPLERATLSN